MTALEFGRKYYTLFGVYLILLGLVLALAPHSKPVEFVFNSRIDPTFFGDSPKPSAFLDYQAWIYGLLGATVAGWGLMIMFVGRFGVGRGEKWAWWAIALSFGLWYLVDTGISAAYGVGFNVAFNTILLVAAAIPLGVTYRTIIRR